MAKVNAFIDGWMSHRKALLQLLDTVEDEHLDFRPWDQAMTLSELVLHISGSSEMFVNIVKTGAFAPPAEHEVKSANELRETIQNETNETNSILESLTDEQLERMVEFRDMQMPGSAMLEMMKEHEIHHKGQLFTYARIAGIEELPFFVSRD